MDADDLTTEQAKVLCESIRPMLAYLHRLRTRMDRRHFGPDDALRLKVERAYDALHSLTVDLHYRSCPGQSGR